MRVIEGAPPPSGPARLEFVRGQRIRFRVRTDAALGMEIPGYGVSEVLEAGTTTLSFPATRVGQFPVIAAETSIGLATLRVRPRRPTS